MTIIDTLKLLRNRCDLAIGSLTLVDKQLLGIRTVIDDLMQNCYDGTLRGEEENSDSDFFITPPVSVYGEVEQ